METATTSGIGSRSVSESPTGYFARRPMLAFTALIAVNAMWAFQFAGVRIATEELGAVLVTLVPLALATLLVLPFARLSCDLFRRKYRPVLLDVLLLGTLGVLPAQLCVVLGVQRTLATNASALALTVPVLTAISASVFLNERMTRLRWVSFLIAIVGVCMIASKDIQHAHLLRFEYVLGNLYVLASCAGSAFNNSYSRRVLSHFSPPQVLVWTFVVADIELLLIEIATDRSGWRQLFHLPPSVWWSLILIAVFSLGISMLLYFSVIQSIEVIKAALSVYLLPVFGLLFSMVLLRESPTLNLIVGGLLIFISCFLVTICEEQQRIRGLAPKIDEITPLAPAVFRPDDRSI
jgi:drug/metabolite transporter (DMT)-like permease